MDKETNKDIWQVLGYAFLIILLAILGNIFVGCCPRVIAPTEIKDSVRVEIHERIIHDTVSFEIEKEVEKVVTRDTVSYLENTYASSEARVDGGFLYHSLESRPQTIYVPYTVEVHDTTTVEGHSETIIKEVEKNLTKWQVFSMVLGRVLGGLLIGFVITFALFKYLKI